MFSNSQSNSINVSAGFASPLELPELLSQAITYDYNEGILLKSSISKSLFASTSIALSAEYFNGKIKNQSSLLIDGGISRTMLAVALEFEITNFKRSGLRFNLGPGYEIERQSKIVILDSRVSPSYEIEIESQTTNQFIGVSNIKYYLSICNNINYTISAGYSYHHNFGRRRAVMFHLTTGISYTFLSTL
ncbi:hypothetical protein [Portibacter lacus]|uniref:Uncharacterized protein n=1 Tax=Portibacter lacus TaxID=1099794 RepID=A0AA37WD36_9BACT|nr:hypothetical protein [Portibacter lacus]GLR16483.1 hypothetical protein GCM10007940_10980 [Portibacter lacus]